MKNESETRAAAAPVEVREAEGGAIKVAGYAAVFNEWADIAGLFQERIAPGAFDDVLEDDVRFLINHTGLPLARKSSGTLALKVDDHGLHMETTLDPADPDAQRIISKMKRGDLREMSFAFRVGAEEWDETGDVVKRTITKVKQLIDVAIVTTPAYPGTEIGLRSLEAHRAQEAGDKDLQAARVRRLRMQLTLQA